MFCRFDYRDEHRDLIHFTNGCASGWFYNFPRYGGNPQTDKTILVDHKAFSSFIGIRSILSLNVTGKRIIYIAGKSTKNVMSSYQTSDGCLNLSASSCTHFSCIFMQGIASETKAVIVIETSKISLNTETNSKPKVYGHCKLKILINLAIKKSVSEQHSV